MVHIHIPFNKNGVKNVATAKTASAMNALMLVGKLPKHILCRFQPKMITTIDMIAKFMLYASIGGVSD
jgi:hypothetical protein